MTSTEEAVAHVATGQDIELPAALPWDAGNHEFVSRSAAMEVVIHRLRKVATLDTSVVLIGESGTGKELFANWLHEHHPSRRNGPMIRVHCGAIPEGLLESELFGHVRGAFTSADHDRAGVFELANGGTLFLDEISTMPLAAQVRLLRVLQERVVTRVGCTKTRNVDVRVVAASSDPLRDLVERGDFRLDLFYRISVFPIVLPALRDRHEDLPGLAETLVRRISGRLGICRNRVIGPEMLSVLSAHDWPGNVRELENALEHAYILAGDEETLRPEHLPPEIADLPPAPAGGASAIQLTEEGISLRSAVSSLERELILQSLQLTEGNKARAAQLLNLRRTTFLEKLKRLEEAV